MDKKKMFKALGIIGSICTIVGTVFGTLTEKSNIQEAVDTYMKEQQGK